MTVVRIGTRRSTLAVWQAQFVGDLLVRQEPGLTVELVKIATEGDRIQDVPLTEVGGKGLFVKEIEEALLDGRIDLAVHSLKDVPAVVPEGLMLAAFPPRADPRDAWVSPVAARVEELPLHARVGTASLRRSCQLLARRSDLTIIQIRGNVETRLRKIETEGLLAVVLAAAGMDRLGLGERITRRLPVEEMLPAVGQGILAVEVRQADARTLRRVKALDDPEARKAACCERAMLDALGGSCQVPIAGYAIRDREGWWMRGLVARPDGRTLVHAEDRAPAQATEAELEALGRNVARRMLRSGGGTILAELGVSLQSR